MIVWCPIAIALSIIVDPVVDDLVLAAGSREGLTAVEHPGGIESPAIVQSEHTNDIDVVTTVVIGVVPLSAVDAVDTGFRPREGIGEPTRQPAAVLTGTEFHTVTLSVASQRQTLNLDFAAERLAVAIVEHVLDFPVIALHAEVIVLLRRHHIESSTPLVCNLRLHDITADGIAVEGC